MANRIFEEHEIHFRRVAVVVFQQRFFQFRMNLKNTARVATRALSQEAHLVQPCVHALVDSILRVILQEAREHQISELFNFQFLAVKMSFEHVAKYKNLQFNPYSATFCDFVETFCSEFQISTKRASEEW